VREREREREREQEREQEKVRDMGEFVDLLWEMPLPGPAQLWVFFFFLPGTGV
jgi:hypothetical protein